MFGRNERNVDLPAAFEQDKEHDKEGASEERDKEQASKERDKEQASEERDKEARA